MNGGLDEDDPSFLGYVCLGSAAGREHALNALNAAVREVGAEWLKLDFNIDPDRGCTRTDHGHGAGDGLLRHYEGLYAVIDQFRAENPGVIFEACASGGLRVDLGLARHVHCFFLSDPDYTDHHLQVAWGTSLMLPPVAMLHWSWSQFRMDFPDGDMDFSTLAIDEFDTMLRAAMIHRFGFSLRLPELKQEQLDRLAWHTRLFNEVIAPFVRVGVLRRLTPQPLRRGNGNRSPVFQISSGDRHLVMAYRLQGGATPSSIQLDGLADGAQYQARDLSTGQVTPVTDGAVQPAETGDSVSSWMYLVERAA
jgi:alpha-galactosidase